MLTEEQMRLALFGPDTPSAPKVVEATLVHPQLPSIPKPKAPKLPSSTPKLRVIIHATRDFEGEIEVLIHESSSLSTLLAQQEAKQAAKKKKFKYVDVISVIQI
ncbi:hypothetical protein [Pseudomonas syringae]|uniref:hypothetical protein n=1 Tax=Pseudomonas syringae TaxID=317 RepID=UPI001EFC1BE2|nr:hypothetical protein [Pseudomonas syringae]